MTQEERESLAVRLRIELENLERGLTRATRLMDKSKQDNDYLDGVALNLHSFYAGAERMFSQIATELDRSVPSDEAWHRSLLLQMAGQLKSMRPAVIRAETLHCLDEYRSFRHVVRNIYTFNLRPASVEALVEIMHDCYHNIQRDMTEFCTYLETPFDLSSP